jgi:hypothetical protein
MELPRRSWILTALLALLATGCALGASRPATDPAKRWVLISNPRYSAQGPEPEYVWVEEDKIPTSLTTVLFGKKAIIAPPDIVPRYGPPPGNGLISRLQGGPYAQQAATLPTAGAPKTLPPAAPGGPAPPGGAAAAPSNAVTPRGYVVYVDSNRIVIDLTVQHGLKAGDVVRITREKIPLVHPITGAYLGELDEDVATAQIVELREKFAVAEIREVKPGAQIRVKDRVVPRP